MHSITADVVVIGAGSAGLTAYRAARSHGKKVLLIECGPHGTTCARVGCMPSKLLIAAAEAAHMAGIAPAFGVHTAPVRIDGREVMARVRRERDRFVGFVLDTIDHMPDTDKLHGPARFLSPHRLQVGDHTLVEAGQIVIATGSQPHVPVVLQHLGDRLVTSDQIFEWKELPESVAVVGTGVVGLEIGQALHRLGVRVAFFGRSAQLAGIKDPTVLAAAHATLGAELDLRLNVELSSATRSGAGVALTWASRSDDERTKQQTNQQTEQFSLVLAASGRKPAIAQLSLAESGLALDERGIPVFDSHTMQCGTSAIFIAGDVTSERPVLHEAVDQGRIAGDNAGRYPDVRPGLRRVPLAIAFTDPQMAVVGAGFTTIAANSHAIGEVGFRNQGRSRVMLQNHGLLRVYAERGSGRFLGAEICGPRAEHLAHLMAWALQSEMTVSAMLEMPFYHPVVEEGLRTALRALQEDLQGPIRATA
ncbi:MAG: dihydrolipoyl dehydrogenase [Pseudomonadota bacterium]